MRLRLINRVLSQKRRLRKRRESFFRGPTRRLSFEWLEQRALLAAVFWDGEGDGIHWSDPLNWSGDALPGAADDVDIDFGTNTIQHDSGTTTIRSLVMTNSFALSGSVLSVDSLTSPEVTLLSGAVLTSPASTATEMHRLEITVSGTFAVDTPSRIDVSEKGYVAGRTTGNSADGAATASSGGSYGGLGGNSDPNRVYGDYRDPNDWGSGGSSSMGVGSMSTVTDQNSAHRSEAGAVNLEGRTMKLIDGSMPMADEIRRTGKRLPLPSHWYQTNERYEYDGDLVQITNPL